MSWSVPPKYKSICDDSDSTDSEFKIVLDIDKTPDGKAKVLKDLAQAKTGNNQFCKDALHPNSLSIYSSPRTTASQALKLQAAMLYKNRWDQYQNLKIKFLDGSEDDHNWVKNVVNRTYTPDIMNLTLEWLQPDDSRLSDIRISFIQSGSWSYLGKECLSIPQNEPTMNLAWLDKPTDLYLGPSETLDGGVIKHEFGHCLGPWIHEHQNPAGSTIQWNVPVVVMSLRGPPNNWKDSDICTNIFPKYSQDQLRGTIYDKDSIMQYFYPNDWVEDRKGTKVNQYLSPQDKQFLQKTYPPGGPRLLPNSPLSLSTTPLMDIDLENTDGKDTIKISLIITVVILIIGIIITGIFLMLSIYKCNIKISSQSRNISSPIGF
jgi:hypothetical protein